MDQQSADFTYVGRLSLQVAQQAKYLKFQPQVLGFDSLYGHFFTRKIVNLYDIFTNEYDCVNNNQAYLHIHP